jgi:glycosyltransferase involved in cell wall biosynthesis
MHNKLLLVTIPSYRQPEQLDRALQGLANQTCKDFSVVIIDDNSGTDIASITKKYKDNISITVEKNENNIGAMNNLYRSITFKTNSR